MAKLFKHNARFTDVLVFDANTKTVLSSRDGVSEYYGEELGIEPADKCFLVYRSPAIVANMAMKMPGIPVVDNHRMVEGDAQIGPEGGTVAASEMIDMIDDSVSSTVAIRNKITVSDTLLAEIDAGKRELSVDGEWKLATRDTLDPLMLSRLPLFDLAVVEQIPEHLAICENARQGHNMRFLDSKPKGTPMKKFADKFKAVMADKKFCDADGALNLQGLMEIVMSLPDSIKNVPLDQIAGLEPHVQEILKIIKGGKADGDGDEGKAKEADADESPEEKKKREDDEAAKKAADEGDPEKKKDEDAKKFGDAVAKRAQEFADAAIKERDGIIEKARGFVDAAYVFSGKSNMQIMRDVLATQTSEKFADAEVPTHFKFIKKFTDYSRFGADNSDGFDALKDKEI